MDEYIRREDAIAWFMPYAHVGESIDADVVISDIKGMKAADVAQVRHGRWERIGIKGRKGLPIYPCCSACGIVSAAFRSEWEGLRGQWKYCPNCGAKMDG